MPKLEVTTTDIATIIVEPEVGARLDALLQTYQMLKIDADLLYDQMEEEKRKMKGEMELAGLEKISINGTPCTIVRGEQSTLDKLKFVELGGSLATLENATSKKPKKAYLAIGKDKE
jgi:hypothetical protein